MTYKIEKLDLDSLSQEKRKKYGLFIPPQSRSTIEGKDPDNVSDTIIIAIGLEHNGDPVGLVIGGVFLDASLVEIYSIKLLEEHQNVDLAVEMLNQLVVESSETGAIILVSHFRKTDRDSSFLETILEKAEWSKPKLFVVRYFFDSRTFYPPWFDLPPKLPPKYKLFRWDKLKSKDRNQVEKDYSQGHFSDLVYPFQKEETIEPSCSLGLRYKTKVVGWSLLQRVAPDAVKYSALYVNPEFQFTGYAIRLLVESIKLQKLSPIRWAVFEINLEGTDKSWIKFVQRRLAPYSIATDEIYQSWKTTSSDAFTLDGIV